MYKCVPKIPKETWQITWWPTEVRIFHSNIWNWNVNVDLRHSDSKLVQSHAPSDHHEDGGQHIGADPQRFWIEALDQQRAQGWGVAQDDDQRHGSRLEGQDGSQKHAFQWTNPGWKEHHPKRIINRLDHMDQKWPKEQESLWSIVETRLKSSTVMCIYGPAKYCTHHGTAIEGNHHAPAEEVPSRTDVNVGESKEAQAGSCKKELCPNQATFLVRSWNMFCYILSLTWDCFGWVWEKKSQMLAYSRCCFSTFFINCNV